MAKSAHVDHRIVTPVAAAAARDVGAVTLRYLHERLQIDEEWTQRRERGFSWWAHRLPQHIDAGRPIDAEVWAGAYQLAQRARSAGVSVPATDILIAACASRHGAELETADSDFERLTVV